MEESSKLLDDWIADINQGDVGVLGDYPTVEYNPYAAKSDEEKAPAMGDQLSAFMEEMAGPLPVSMKGQELVPPDPNAITSEQAALLESKEAWKQSWRDKIERDYSDASFFDSIGDPRTSAIGRTAWGAAYGTEIGFRQAWAYAKSLVGGGGDEEAVELSLAQTALGEVLDEYAGGSYPERLARGASRSVMTYTLMGPLGAPGAAAHIFPNSFVDARTQAIAEGYTEDQAFASAFPQAVIESGLTLAGGFRKRDLEQAFRTGRWGGVKETFKVIRDEALKEEVPIEVGKKVAEAIALNKDLSLNELLIVAADTTIQTAATVGLARGLQVPGEALDRFIANPSRRNAASAGLGGISTKEGRDAVASGIATARFREQLSSLVGTAIESEEQANYLFRLVEYRAHALGETVDGFLGRWGLDIRQADWAEGKDAGSDVLGEPDAQRFVDSPQFVQWFGDSKAVNEDGSPKVYYHGTPHGGFEYFDAYSGWSGLFGRGVYFTEDPDVASEYASASRRKKGSDDGGAAVYPVFLSIRNPMDMDAPADIGAWMSAFGEGSDAGLLDASSLAQAVTNEDAYRVVEDALINDGAPAYDAADTLQFGIRDMGHDGITHIGGGRVNKDGTRHRVMIAFDPEQVKSATGNTGLFDGIDANILADDRGRNRPRRAQIDFTQQGNTVISAFQAADFTSMVHELGHLFRRDLAGDELSRAAKWSGVKKGNWTVQAEEKFANGFVKWLREGESKRHPLSRFFRKFKGWLGALHDAVRQRKESRIEITPEIADLFRGMFSEPAPTKAVEAATAPQAAPDGPQQEEAQVEAQEAGGPQEAAQSPTGDLAPSVLEEDSDLSRVSQRWRGLANHAEADAVREANYEADAALPGPDRQRQADSRLAALRRIQADPDGEMAALLAKIEEARRTGGTVHMEDMTDAYVMAELRNALAEDFIATGSPRSRRLHRQVNEAFRNARTRQAQMLGIRDPVERSNGIERRNRKTAVAAMTAETNDIQRRRAEARTEEEHRALDAEVDERYNRIAEELKAQGIDVSDIDSFSKDTGKVVKVIQAFRPKDASTGDMAFEFWRNAILSGPRTQALNAIGVPVFYGYRVLGERVMASAFNIFGKDKTAPTFGEYAPMMRAFFASLPDAMRNAARAFALEMPQLEESLGRTGYTKLDNVGGAIPGKFGRLVRAIGYRQLMAFDDFNKTYIANMEAAAYAYRIAKAEGAPDVEARIAELMADKTSAAWDMGIQEALRASFQGEGGVVAEKTKETIDTLRKIPGGKYIIPFRDTLANIFEEGVRRMPALGFMLDYAEARRSGKSIQEAIGDKDTLARQAIAAYVLMMLLDQDEENPWLTGTKVEVPPDGRYMGPPPQSIKVGDTWYSYARLEPFATSLAFIADLARGIHREDTTIPLRSFGVQLKDKNFLDGVGDAVEAVSAALGEGDLRKFGKWGAKFAASWVPNVIRQPVDLRQEEAYIPQMRVWGKGLDYWKMMGKRAKQDARIFGVEPTARYDPFGRRLTYQAPNTSLPFRLLSPVSSREMDEMSKVEMAMFVWNERHPDEAKYWTSPNTYYRQGGETIYYTDEEYANYAKLSGEIAAQMIKGHRSLKRMDPENPKKHHIEIIADILKAARSRASSQIKTPRPAE